MITAEIKETAVSLFSDKDGYIGNIALERAEVGETKEGRHRITIYPPKGYEPSFLIVDEVLDSDTIFGLYEKLKAYEGEEAKIAKRDREGQRVD